MSFHLIARTVWTIAICGVSAFAILRGGRVARIVALANLGAWGASLLLENRSNFLDPQWGVLLVDLGFLTVLLFYALREQPSWLLFAAAFQLLSVLTHIAILIDAGVHARAYLQGLAIWSYLVLLSLAIGTWLHWRDQRLAGG